MSDDPEFEVQALDEVHEDSSVNLPTGDYYVRNRTKDASGKWKDNYASRNHIEDRSLHPKKVHCPTDGPFELLHLERLHNGRYKISSRGAPTADISKLLYALLINKEKAEEWNIYKRGVADHRTLYTIQKADGEGWVKQVERGVADPQVAVRHLRATKSIPPQYEPAALWNIQPLVLHEQEG